MATTTLDYLLPMLRFKIGDYIEPYRYLDEWLILSLNTAAKIFQWYNKSKYLIDDANLVSRNPTSNYFTTLEDNEGVIEKKDEPILVLIAEIAIVQGSLENAAWSTVSWKDAEISFSNLESGRLRDSNLDRLWNELNDLILPPTKRLATPYKGSLPGYRNNSYEREGDL